MLSGRRLDLLDPSPLDVEVEDIAHGLARVARWNGQTSSRYPFSVAQHSLVVEELAGRLRPNIRVEQRLAALLHDAPEYVIGDMISPFKAMLGNGYKEIEARLERAIHIRFGLAAETPVTLHRLIKRADRMCAWMEACQIAGFSETEANKLFLTPPADLQMVIIPVSPKQAQAAFLKRFHELHEACDQSKAKRNGKS